MSILDKTINLFDLYRYVCGDSEVPAVYHFWACVAGISATLSDNCWFEIIPGMPLKPNLYVGLLGDGSIGKGWAISEIVRLVQSSTDTPTYRGKLTAPHLTDKLGKPYMDEQGRKRLANPRLWLIMDELKNGVGSNKQLCEDLIAMMTEIYTGSHYPIQTGTRTGGEITIDKSCLSWLFGSTDAWLRHVLTKDTFESGFIARCIFVKAKYNTKKRMLYPEYPADRDEIWNHLQSRFWALPEIYTGSFSITKAAKATVTRWYDRRPAPEDKMLYSIWYRQKEMIFRFAMILCVADGLGMEINKNHVAKAIAMVNQAFKYSEKLVEAASESFESKITNDVATVLQEKVAMKHCDLLKYLNSRRGYTAQKTRIAIADLKERLLIDTQRSPTGGVVYIWRK